MEMLLSAARAALTGLLEKCRKKPAVSFCEKDSRKDTPESVRQPRVSLPEESQPEYANW